MKRRLKLTLFAKMTLVALTILGVRFIYLNANNLNASDLFNFNIIKQKVNNFFNENNNKKLPANNAIEIFITEGSNYFEIKTSGKTIKKIKSGNNNTDTFLFRISEEKLGKIIYKKIDE